MTPPATATPVIFTCGFLGSLGVELVSLLQVFHTEPITMPERYRRPLFWLLRFILALAGGGLAVAYEIEKPLLAINIGASAPLILQALAQGIQNLHGSRPSAAVGASQTTALLPQPENQGPTAPASPSPQ